MIKNKIRMLIIMKKVLFIMFFSSMFTFSLMQTMKEEIITLEQIITERQLSGSSYQLLLPLKQINNTSEAFMDCYDSQFKQPERQQLQEWFLLANDNIKLKFLRFICGSKTQRFLTKYCNKNTIFLTIFNPYDKGCVLGTSKKNYELMIRCINHSYQHCIEQSCIMKSDQKCFVMGNFLLNQHSEQAGELVSQPVITLSEDIIKKSSTKKNIFRGAAVVIIPIVAVMMMIRNNNFHVSIKKIFIDRLRCVGDWIKLCIEKQNNLI